MGFLRFINTQFEEANPFALLIAGVAVISGVFAWLAAMVIAMSSESLLGFFAALTSPAALGLLVLWLQYKSRGTDE